MALSWTIHLAAIAWLIAQGSGDLAARARAVRRFASHAALSSLTFAAGVALLAAHVGVHALSMNSLTALELDPAVQLLAGALFVVAALSRGAIFPFHTWLLPALDAAPYIAGVSLVGLPLGAYVLAHVVLPITPDAGATLMAACVTLATAQIVYGALLAIVQRSLSRTVSAVALSLSGLSLLGISEVALMTLDGAILLALATGITLSGLLLVIATLRERAGTTDIARLGGLVHTMPRLTAWCFIFSVATFGIPGSLSFIAGDLILQGTYATHPVIAIIVLSCAALNGITLVRAWSLTFLGQPRAASLVAAQRPAVVDLHRAEHAVAFAIALVALLLGLMPARIIDAEERDAIKLVQQHDNNAHQDSSVAAEEPRHDH
jgi:NADH-quinone oxidoreductase subunit M